MLHGKILGCRTTCSNAFTYFLSYGNVLWTKVMTCQRVSPARVTTASISPHEKYLMHGCWSTEMTRATVFHSPAAALDCTCSWMSLASIHVGILHCTNPGGHTHNDGILSTFPPRPIHPDSSYYDTSMYLPTQRPCRPVLVAFSKRPIRYHSLAAHGRQRPQDAYKLPRLAGLWSQWSQLPARKCPGQPPHHLNHPETVGKSGDSCIESSDTRIPWTIKKTCWLAVLGYCLTPTREWTHLQPISKHKHEYLWWTECSTEAKGWPDSCWSSTPGVGQCIFVLTLAIATFCHSCVQISFEHCVGHLESLKW